MKRIIVVLLLLALTLTGCTPNSASFRTVIDGAGVAVNVPENAENAVCLGKILNTVVAISGTDNIKYISEASKKNITDFARLVFPQIDDITVIPNDITSEALIALNPDVAYIIMPNEAEIYRNAGIPTVVLSSYSIDEMLQSFDTIAVSSGEKAVMRAQYARSFFNDTISYVSDALADVSAENKPRVHYINAVSSDNVYVTDAAGTVVEQSIIYAGGQLATDITGRSVEITPEVLLDSDPEFIVIGGNNQEAVYNTLMNDSLYSNMSAVVNKNVYISPYGLFHWSRAGIESPLFILWLASLLHPESVTEADVIEHAQRLYYDMYEFSADAELIRTVINGKGDFTNAQS